MVSRFVIVATTICFALSGCGKEVNSPPAVQLVTKEVRVPVPVACLKTQDLNALISAEPARVKAQLNGDAVHDLDITAASAIRLRAWGHELLAALQACTD